MYPYNYIHYLNFPKLPDDIFSTINFNIGDYIAKSKGSFDPDKPEEYPDVYTWSDSFNEQINKWGQENICPTVYFAFQIFTGDVPLHKDVNALNNSKSLLKLNYVLLTGGDDVYTEFFDEDKTTKLASYKIDQHRWHVLKSDAYHRVVGVDSGQVRFSITCKMF